ncbi:MAG: hypothetical protein KJP19_06735, partial [Deltaproteobacteria bacterium]|nr:hypothetical protein [Deltaproteobacteria bacterium]
RNICGATSIQPPHFVQAPRSTVGLFFVLPSIAAGCVLEDGILGDIIPIRFIPDLPSYHSSEGGT